jgi:hypothetical protein
MDLSQPNSYTKRRRGLISAGEARRGAWRGRAISKECLCHAAAKEENQKAKGKNV